VPGRKPTEIGTSAKETRTVHCDLGYQPPNDKPPLTLIVWPVTCEAASEARKTATAATSSAEGGRPNGKRSTTLVNKSR
jgi:hypothetical protein